MYSSAVIVWLYWVELVKSLFDKVALGGVVAAFALVIGWFIEDAKGRRNFVATAQLTAATEMLTQASALASAAADWVYNEAPEIPANQPYGAAFERATIPFGRAWGAKRALLPTYFAEALTRFYDLLLEPYYLYRDHKPNPLEELGTTHLDCAEFIGVLEKSLYLEFLAAAGARGERPGIRLAIVDFPKGSFRDLLARWQQQQFTPE